MITAIDTNILLDVLAGTSEAPSASELRLDSSRERGALVICEAVYAELSARFSHREQLDGFLHHGGIQLRRSSDETLWLAGQACRRYSARRPRSVICTRCSSAQLLQCTDCGEALAIRQHVLADFLIGAHALLQADRLLTRDRGYYSTYFSTLRLE